MNLLFDPVQLFHCKCHNINFRCGGSYIESLDKKIKNKKTNRKTNPINEDNKRPQYAVTVALNYGEIEYHPEKVLNIIPFINKYNCDGIKYPSETDDWKTLEKNNPTIAHNILDIKKKKYVLLIFQKLIQIVKKKKKLLMIPDVEKEG